MKTATLSPPVAVPHSSPPAAIFPHTPENHPRRWISYALLVILVGLVAWAIAGFHQPANSGVDQNGYMTTARMLVEYHRLYFKPHNPFQFVGHMMIQTPDGRIYAKYPPGMGVLGALAWMIGGGPGAMYLVDPVCTVLACLLSFFIFRRMLGNFLALMGVIWLACNPVTLTYANDANSHGAALFFTVLGFWNLLAWWEKGSVWRGMLAGLALGFCCWIRYTEFLWVVPLIFVVALQWWSARRPSWECMVVLAAFCIPVAILAGIQWVAFGEPWRTGYAFCKEQTGFSWKYFIGNPGGIHPRQGNWQTVLEQFSNLGLFLLFPLAIAGLVRLFWVHWKPALMLVLWVVPSATLYMFYYWAPTNINTTGYLRFFLDIFPALILAALWLLDQAMGQDKVATAITVGLLTLLGSAYNLYTMAPRLLAQSAQKLNLVQAREVVKHDLPPDSVIFVDQGIGNYLNSVSRYRLYAAEMFSPNFFKWMQNATEQTGPHGLQKSRSEAYLKLLGQKGPNGKLHARSAPQLRLMELQLIRRAWKKHRTVVFLMRRQMLPQFVPTGRNLKAILLASWQSPMVHPWFNALWMNWFQGHGPAAQRRWQRMQWNWQRNNQWALMEILPSKGNGP